MGEIKEINGVVRAIAADGSMRELRVGDKLAAGERLEFAPGATMLVAGLDSSGVLVTAEMLTDGFAPASVVPSVNETVAAGTTGFDDIINSGNAPAAANTVLVANASTGDLLAGQEAPAAGAGGAGQEDGGHSAYYLGRIAEDFDAGRTQEPVALASISGPRAVALALETQPTTINVANTKPGPNGTELTNDNTPDLIGRSIPTSTVTVTLPDGTVIGTAQVQGDGSWTLTVPTALPDGPVQFIATSNQGGDPANTTVTIDTKTFVTLDDHTPNPDNILITEDSTPVVTGTGEPGSTITLTETVSGAPRGVTSVGPDGKWSIELKDPLPIGSTKLTATAEDPAGNSSSTTGVINVLDPLVPPVITSATDNVGPKTGLVPDGGSTDDSTPTVVGTATPGFTVNVYEQGPNGTKIPLGTATTMPDGTWTLEVPGLPEGPHTFIATAINPKNEQMGVESPPSNTYQVIIDLSVSPLADVVITPDTNNDGFINYLEMGGATPLMQIPVDGLLSTTAKIGDVVTFTDKETGQVRTATVDQAALDAHKVTVTFPNPGDNGKLSISATVTDAVGNVSAPAKDVAIIDLSQLKPVVITLDEDANGDAILNRAEQVGPLNVSVTLPADVVVGDKLIITATGNTPKEIVLTAVDVAAHRVETSFPNQSPNGTHVAVTAQVVDPAGNKSNLATDSAVVMLDAAGAPLVTIVDDTNNDGFLNRTEFGNGEIEVSSKLPANAAVNDTVFISLNSPTLGLQNAAGIVLTQADLDKGSVSVLFANVPALPEGENLRAEAKIQNVAGNLSPTGTDNAIVDLSDIKAPVITVTDDKNLDNILNAAELADDKQVDINVTVPAGAKAGDTMKVTASGNTDKVFPLTQADIDKGSVALEFNPTPDPSTMIFTAQVTDPAGNASPIGQEDILIRVDLPGAPIVVITEDANNDGFINGQELVGKIDVSIALPATARPDHVLVYTVQGQKQEHVLTPADIAAKSFPVQVDNPGEGVTLTVTAQIRDTAGNEGAVGSDHAIIDTLAPKPMTDVVIVDDANNDGFVNFVEMGGATPKTQLTVQGFFDKTDVAKGFVVTFTEPATGETHKVTLTQANVDAGFVDVKFAAPADGGKLTVLATIADLAGNVSAPAKDLAQIDLSQFKNVGINLDEDSNNDGMLTATEQQGPVNVTVTLTPDAKANDKLIVTGTNNLKQEITLTTEHIAAGKVAVVFPTQPAAGTTFTATATLTDEAGNKSPLVMDSATTALAPASAPSVTITEDTNNDGWINRTELSGEINVKVGLPPEATAGQTLRVTDGTTPRDIILTPAMIAAKEVPVSFPAPAPADGKTVTVTATINNGTPGSDTAVIDLSDIKAPVITVTDDKNGDNILNGTELADDKKVDISVKVPEGAAAGDTMTVTASGNTQQSVVLTPEDIAKGSVPFEFNPTGDGTTMTFTAQVKDPAGNTSPTAEKQVAIDASVTAAPNVLITEDSDNDGRITPNELAGKINVDIGLPARSEVGDRLNYTTVVNGVVQSGSKTLTQADINLGAVKLELDAPRSAAGDVIHGAEVKVTASITDVAGNTSAEGSDKASLASAPAITTNIVGMSKDIGDSGHDWLTGDGQAGRGVYGELSRALVAGEKVEVSFDGGRTWQGAAVAGQTWAISDMTAAHNASWEYQARVVSSVPGVGVIATDTQAVVLDSINPAPVGSITAADVTAGMLTVSLGGAVVGDILHINWGETTYDVTLTTAQVASPTFTLPVPAAVLAASADTLAAHGISVQLIDDAGRVSDFFAGSNTLNLNRTITFDGFTDTNGLAVGDVSTGKYASVTLIKDGAGNAASTASWKSAASGVVSTDPVYNDPANPRSAAEMTAYNNQIKGNHIFLNTGDSLLVDFKEPAKSFSIDFFSVDQAESTATDILIYDTQGNLLAQKSPPIGANIGSDFSLGSSVFTYTADAGKEIGQFKIVQTNAAPWALQMDNIKYTVATTDGRDIDYTLSSEDRLVVGTSGNEVFTLEADNYFSLADRGVNGGAGIDTLAFDSHGKLDMVALSKSKGEAFSNPSLTSIEAIDMRHESLNPLADQGGLKVSGDLETRGGQPNTVYISYADSNASINGIEQTTSVLSATNDANSTYAYTDAANALAQGNATTRLGYSNGDTVLQMYGHDMRVTLKYLSTSVEFDVNKYKTTAASPDKVLFFDKDGNKLGEISTTDASNQGWQHVKFATTGAAIAYFEFAHADATSPPAQDPEHWTIDNIYYNIDASTTATQMQDTIVLSVNEVLHSGTIDAFRADSYVQMKIVGDTGGNGVRADRVELQQIHVGDGSTKDAGEWKQTGATVVLDGVTFDVYRHSTQRAEVFIQQGLEVNFPGVPHPLVTINAIPDDLSYFTDLGKGVGTYKVSGVVADDPSTPHADVNANTVVKLYVNGVEYQGGVTAITTGPDAGKFSFSMDVNTKDLANDDNRQIEATATTIDPVSKLVGSGGDLEHYGVNYQPVFKPLPTIDILSDVGGSGYYKTNGVVDYTKFNSGKQNWFWGEKLETTDHQDYPVYIRVSYDRADYTDKQIADGLSLYGKSTKDRNHAEGTAPSSTFDYGPGTAALGTSTFMSYDAATNSGVFKFVFNSGSDRNYVFHGDLDKTLDAVLTVDRSITGVSSDTDLASVYDHQAYNRAPPGYWTPLVLDRDGDGVETLGLGDGVKFDGDGDGVAQHTGWVGKDDALLVHDLNHDGKINDGSELFGEHTRLADGTLAKNGFEAMAQFDSNHDGVLDAKDAIYNELQIWQDSNSDGITEKDELSSLLDAGIVSLNLHAEESDVMSNGNLIGLKSAYTDASGANHELSDVWFAQDSTSQPLDLSQSDSVLNLSDILVGENNDNLGAYLHFQQNGDETVVLMSTKGQFNGQNYAETADHAVTVSGLDVHALGGNDQDVIKFLQDHAKLVVDQHV